MTSFENILIKKKTKRYEPGQRYFTSEKKSLHHPGHVVYAPVTSQRGIIQQMLQWQKMRKSHFVFKDTVSLDTLK